MRGVVSEHHDIKVTDEEDSMSARGQTAGNALRLLLTCVLLAAPVMARAFDAVLLPEQGPWARAGEDVRLGLIAAYQTQEAGVADAPELRFFDSSTGDIRALYDQVVASGATLVIGPIEKDKVDALLSDPHRLSVKTLLLNRSSLPAPPQSWQFSLSPEDEIPALVAAAHHAGLQRVLILHDDDPNDSQRAAQWAQAWRTQDGASATEAVIPERQPLLKTLSALLFTSSEQATGHGRHRHHHLVLTPRDFDAVFLACGSRHGSQIHPLLVHLHRDLPVYALSTAIDLQGRIAQRQDLQGVIYAELPALLLAPADLRLFTALQATHSSDQRLFALGMDSWTLAQKLASDTPDWPLAGHTGSIDDVHGQLLRQPSLSRMAADGPVRWEQP